MEDILGTSVFNYFMIVVVIMGFCAYMTGQAMAVTWKPIWHVVIYGVLLGVAARFLVFALVEGELLTLGGLVIDTIVMLVIGLFAFMVNRARKMVSQYPWVYERSGLFGWRQRHP